MKIEISKNIVMKTTPNQLIDLAKKWQRQIESSNYKENEVILMSKIGNTEITLELDHQQYGRETGKVIIKNIN